jgi:2-amino-4-hydroxy-6-hydroxymethyldihydropteridine diphosphokinase / dihydropteroate synthase
MSLTIQKHVVLVVVVMSFCMARSTATTTLRPSCCTSNTTTTTLGVKVWQSLSSSAWGTELKTTVPSKDQHRHSNETGRQWQHVLTSLPRCGADRNSGSLAPHTTALVHRYKREKYDNNNAPIIPTSRALSPSSGASFQQCPGATNLKHKVFVAVGSNLGNRFKNIASAMSLLCDPDFDSDAYNKAEGHRTDERNLRECAIAPPAHLVRTSFLHETTPMYISDQPAFLNGVVEIETDLEPYLLLRRLKNIEAHLGRNFSTVRNGPRTVDLDILFYFEKITTTSCDTSNAGAKKLIFSPIILDDSPDLIIPHPRIAEREFVLVPLCEVAGHDLRHPGLDATVGGLLTKLLNRDCICSCDGDNTDASRTGTSSPPAQTRIIPLPRGRRILFNETIIMGILNLTPDSFSDGGSYKESVELAVNRALEMLTEGAHIVDIGGESTRPGAKEIPVDEQIQRTIPVVRRLRQLSPEIVLSIDTRHAAVARAAVDAGVDIVNDVSGGLFDPDMLPTVAELGVPIVLMHMRGSPESMQGMTGYANVITEVAAALVDRSRDAEMAGIPRWMQVLDPGIGFSKDLQGNLLLLKHFSTLRALIGDMPILLGTSRKGFIGQITGETSARDRDFGTVASCVAALCLENSCFVGCNILRVHNVKGARQATTVMDAIQKAK